MKNFISILILTLTYSIAQGQTGPGGIQETDGNSELVLWLDASTINSTNGSEITNWIDQSGYGNDAVGTSGNKPTLNTSWENGQPAVSFTQANSDYLSIANSSSTQLNKYEIFVVADMTNNTDDWAPLFAKSSDWYWNDGYAIARDNDNEELVAYTTDLSDQAVYSVIDYSTPFLISSFQSNNKFNIRKDGSKIDEINEGGSLTSVTEPMYIGASLNEDADGVRDFLDGNIAEIIIFNNTQNSTERIIVHNYLAAKYGITTNWDYYSYESTHSNELLGIGRRSSSTHSASRGSGILELSGASSLSNNDFMFIGHDGSDLTKNYDNVAPEYSYRLDRTWRVGERNDVGTVSISFDVSGLGLPTDATEYAILIDNDDDFSDATIHTTGASYSGDEISFTGVDLSDGDYITLAALKAITWDGAIFENGSGPANAPNTNDEDRVFYVSGSNGSLTADASVYKMIVSNSGELTLSSNAALTIANQIENEGTVTVESGAALNQTHSTANENSGSGTYVVKRDALTSPNGYNALSSPISSAYIPTTFPAENPCDIFTFDGDLQLWKYDYTNGYTADCLGNSTTFGSNDVLAGGDGNMDVAKGYFVPGVASSTKTFEGTINNGEITTPIYVEVNPTNVNWTGDDWNLIGNPYPGPIDATAFWNENALNNSRISTAIYFWEDDASAGAGYNQNDDYASWNLLGGTSSSNSGKTPNGSISSGQGFWVIANSNSNVVFNNSMRSGTNTQFFKAESIQPSARIWVSVVSESGDYNQLLVGFKADATDSIDYSYDAVKLSGNPDLSFGSVIGNEVYSIQGLPNLAMNEYREIALELTTNNTGMHVFSIDSLEINDGEFTTQLIDKQTDKSYDLVNGVANVYIGTAGNHKNRFYLAVGKHETNNGNGNGNDNGTTTSVQELEDENNIFTFQEEERIVVDLSASTAKATQLQLINVSGKVMMTASTSGNTQESISTQALASGYYFLNIELDNGTVNTKKIVITK